MRDNRDILDKLATHYKVRCRICQHHNSDMSDVEAVMAQASQEIRMLRLMAGVTIDPETQTLVPDAMLVDRLTQELSSEGATPEAIGRIVGLLADEVLPALEDRDK